MNKFNKGKLVGIIAASLSAVSLMGVGFATWIVGVKQTDASNDINITADSVEYKSIIVGVEFGDSLRLAETAAISDNTYFNSDLTGGAGNLTINTKFKFTLGRDFVESDFQFDTISLSIAEDSAVKNKPTSDAVYLTTRHYEDSLTYFNLPGDVTVKFSNLKKDADQSETISNTYTFETPLTFTWGSMFGEGTSPLNYYEAEIKKDTVKDKAAFMKQAGQELEAMKTRYSTGAKLKLQMNLLKKSA